MASRSWRSRPRCPGSLPRPARPATGPAGPPAPTGSHPATGSYRLPVHRRGGRPWSAVSRHWAPRRGRPAGGTAARIGLAPRATVRPPAALDRSGQRERQPAPATPAPTAARRRHPDRRGGANPRLRRPGPALRRRASELASWTATAAALCRPPTRPPGETARAGGAGHVGPPAVEPLPLLGQRRPLGPGPAHDVLVGRTAQVEIDGRHRGWRRRWRPRPPQRAARARRRPGRTGPISTPHGTPAALSCATASKRRAGWGAPGSLSRHTSGSRVPTEKLAANLGASCGGHEQREVTHDQR